ncbi:hypothetical protein NEI00_10245 [Brachyspira pilosicoli]|uniref:hypothetical protein n=1 Tax=Brachyspira pilosicoli TaxID=52584 RepID=UPI002542B360|nr:hypothetical protein [Brachyspira pilosicoli]WIH83373.1 hypothetical protein NEI00_10245 [Brachyspira pilosicoli]
MNKKILSIIFSLFLVGVFSVSCSNSDKTGSVDNSKGIEQYNGNTYVSTETFDASGFDPSLNPAYMWVSIKDSKVGIYASIDNNTEPTYQGYMNVEGSGTDYTFDSGDGYVSGTLKFTDSSVTVRFTKNIAMPSIEGQDIVCNKK